MSIRQDIVQVRIDFITDESKQFAKTIVDTKKFSEAIALSQREVLKLEKELAKTSTTEERRILIQKEIEVEQKKILANQREIIAAAEKTAKIDLTKLTPAQLIERAKQLAVAMRDIPSSLPEFKALELELKAVNTQLGTIRNNTKGAADNLKQQEGGLSRLTGIAAKVGAAIGVAYAAIASIGGIINATRETEKLFAVLKNAVGGGENKALAIFKELQDFAATTPFALNEVVGAFTKLQQRNFNPTIEQLRTMGDIAAASGKSLDQFVEAILDAQTGEFERLKEFGVVAKKEGDNVNVTFRGQSQTFKNTSENLSAYLLKLGELPGISGATAAVAATLDGSLSNLGDNFTRLFATLGSGGGILKSIVDAFSSLVGKVTEFFTIPLSEKLREQQTEFNSLVGVLKDVNSSEATRNQAIAELQARFPDYIGNVNLQTATEEELNAVLKSGNDLFVRRIFLQSKDEKREEFAKRAIELQNKIFEGEKKLQAAQQRTDEGFTFGLKKEQEIIKFKNVVGAYSQQLTQLSEDQNAFLKEQDDFAKRFKILETPEPSGSPEALAAAAKAAAEAKKRAAEEQAEKDKKAAKATAARQKEELDTALKETEAAALRREVVLEKFRLDGTVNEERYQDGLLGIQRRKYLEQLAVYAKFKKDQTVEALKVQNQLAEIESKTTRPLFTKETAPLAGRTPDAPASTQDNTDQKLAVQDIGENALLLALRSKFEKALITEQDYELKKLELKRLGLAEEIAILQAATVPQVEEIRKREEEKAKVEGQISQKRTDNEQRSEALRQRVQQEGIQATADLFSVAADLLAKDEAARKKNASAIKAFQSAQVVISGVAEVQKIWAGAASLGPIAGPIIGAIQTAVAVGRTVVAINKIQGAKFERGGAVRLAATPISGAATDQGVEIQQISPLRRLWAKAGLAAKPAASSTNTGHFDDGTQVAVKRDESLVVINKKNTPLLQRLSPAIEPMQRLLGKAGVFGGKPHSQGGTKGVFSDGTQIEVERDEAFVVVNHRNTPLLRALSAINAHNGNGVPFFAQRGVKFADGGIEFSKGISPSLNTNPLPLPAAQQSQQAGMEQVEALGRAVIRFEAVVASFPKEVKSRVVYQDIESAGALLDSVRDEAAI